MWNFLKMLETTSKTVLSIYMLANVMHCIVHFLRIHQGSQIILVYFLIKSRGAQLWSCCVFVLFFSKSEISKLVILSVPSPLWKSLTEHITCLCFTPLFPSCGQCMSCKCYALHVGYERWELVSSLGKILWSGTFSQSFCCRCNIL